RRVPPGSVPGPGRRRPRCRGGRSCAALRCERLREDDAAACPRRAAPAALGDGRGARARPVDRPAWRATRHRASPARDGLLRRPRRRRPRRARRRGGRRPRRGPHSDPRLPRARPDPRPRRPRGRPRRRRRPLRRRRTAPLAGRRRHDSGRRGAGGMNLWREAMLVAGKDLRIEARSRVTLYQVLPFGLIGILLFAFALDPSRGVLTRVAPGLFWVAVLLAALLAVSRSFQVETENAARDGLRLSGLDPAAVFLGKAGAIAVQLAVLE